MEARKEGKENEGMMKKEVERMEGGKEGLNKGGRMGGWREGRKERRADRTNEGLMEGKEEAWRYEGRRQEPEFMN